MTPLNFVAPLPGYSPALPAPRPTSPAQAPDVRPLAGASQGHPTRALICWVSRP